MTTFSVLPVAVEAEINRFLQDSSHPVQLDTTVVKQPWRRRWRSVDSLRPEESPPITRSPSPAPSSGVETSSIKDSPMPLDFVAADSSSIGIFFSSGINRLGDFGLLLKICQTFNLIN